MFNYDWFHGPGLQRQIAEAKRRCAAKKFPQAAQSGNNGSPEYQNYLAAL